MTPPKRPEQTSVNQKARHWSQTSTGLKPPEPHDGFCRASSCLRLADSKEGDSTRPTGLPVIELLEERRKAVEGEFVFPGVRGSETFGSFPNQWNRIFGDAELPDFTAHILRHSFASTANDLGFTESTIAALVGHATGSITSKYIHSSTAC